MGKTSIVNYAGKFGYRAHDSETEVCVIVAGMAGRGTAYWLGPQRVLDLPGHPIELAQPNREPGEVPRTLTQSEDCYQTLYHRAPVAYLTLDEQALITDANPRAGTLLITDYRQLVGSWFLTFIAGADRQRFADAYPQIVASLQAPTGAADKPAPSCELRLLTTHGERIICFAATGGSAVNGQPRVHAVLCDLTAQRHAEAALQTEMARHQVTEKILRKERDFAQGLIDVVPSILMELDRDGRIVRCNGFFHKVLGYSPRDVHGQDPIELLVPSAAQAMMRARLFPQEASPGQVGAGEIIPILTRSGQECTVAWRYTALFDEAGQRCGMLVIGLDITERVALEANLRQSQKMEAIGRLASGIAHDFNNLLMGLTGLVEIAASKLPAQSPVRPYLAKVKRAAAAGAGLTSQLLDFSRKRPVELATVDLNRLVERAESMLRCLVPANIALQVNLSRRPLWVTGDPGLLEQVLLNLVANARDAMPRGGTLTITTAGTCPREGSGPGAADPALPTFATLAVTDTGTGMDEDTQGRVFEPFFTTKPQGAGTGLGLSTVYGTVTRCGGHTHLTSAVGQGTTVRTCLPQVTPPAFSDEPSPTDPGVHGDGETILVVEDEALIRATLRHRLGERGYSVITAANGDEALRICRERQGPIALLITDIILPGAPGNEVAREIGKLRPGLPVLYISALPQDRLVREGRIDAQALALQKPFSDRELLAMLEELLPAPGRSIAPPAPVTPMARPAGPRVVLLAENERTSGRAIKELLALADYEVLKADRAQTALDYLTQGAAVDLVLVHGLPSPSGTQAGIALIQQLLAVRPDLPAILITDDGLPKLRLAGSPRVRVFCEPLDFENLLQTLSELLEEPR